MSSPFVLRAVLLTSAALLGVGCGSHGGSGASGAGLPDASVPTPASAAADDKAASTAAAKQALARAALRLAEHEGTWTATHFAQGFSTKIDQAGASLQDLDSKWRLGLHVARVGRVGALRAVEAVGVAERAGRVTIDRGQGVHEWFVHDSRGLEQGVDIDARPAGDGALVVDVAVDGLTPLRARGRQSIELREPSGRSVLRYANLVAKDADGRVLPASMAVAHGGIELSVEDAGARYPIEVDPLIWSQQAELLASDGVASDAFGRSVSISGGTALVGASGRGSGKGAAYVFTQSGTAWSQQAELVASDATTSANFGWSVSVSGDTALVGANGSSSSGAAYVFTRSGGAWTQTAKLLPSDGATNDNFGYSVSLDGGTAVIGAYTKTSATGAAYVFTQSGSTWTQTAKLLASDGATSDFFGFSVSVSGGTALVGAYAKGSAKGAAYVFTQSGSTWMQTAKLLASDGATGDRFGYSVSVSGGTALVGAYYKTSYTGAAYVFTQSGTTWSQQAELSASDGATSDQFGYSVSVAGGTALVGANDKSPYPSTGAAYVFTQSGSTWPQTSKILASDAATNEYFGWSVSVSGGTALVGAIGVKSSTGASVGAAYVIDDAHTNGDACALTSDCLSGFCVDGACCNTSCTGACLACSHAKTGGVDGACEPVLAGTDPDKECAATICTTAGQGTGACDGVGACAPKSPTSCSTFGCNTAATACNTACAADGDCASTAYCVAPTCLAKKALGAACTAADQCTSGFCADGVCCNVACAGSKCQACSAALTGASYGTCTNVSLGKDSHGDCPGTTCTSGTRNLNACNGAGSCGTTTSSCAPFGCNAAGTACQNTCTIDTDCGTSSYCNAGTCAAKVARGGACTASNQCVTGASCADGVCCNEPCAGQCQACGEPGSVGTCIAVKGTPRAPRTACNGTDAACAGSCDGIDIAACAYPSAGQSCGAGCSGGKVAVCDATGTCLAPAPCPGNFTCDSATNKCAAACAADTDCAASFICIGGKCQTKPPATCSPDGLSSIPADDAGPPQTCSPFKCGSDGKCGNSCNSSDDCAAGSNCDTSRSPGQCVLAAAPASSSGGCSTGTGSNASGAGIGLGLLGLTALATRRKRTA